MPVKRVATQHEKLQVPAADPDTGDMDVVSTPRSPRSPRTPSRTVQRAVSKRRNATGSRDAEESDEVDSPVHEPSAKKRATVKALADIEAPVKGEGVTTPAPARMPGLNEEEEKHLLEMVFSEPMKQAPVATGISLEQRLEMANRELVGLPEMSSQDLLRETQKTAMTYDKALKVFEQVAREPIDGQQSSQSTALVVVQRPQAAGTATNQVTDVVPFVHMPRHPNGDLIKHPTLHALNSWFSSKRVLYSKQPIPFYVEGYDAKNQNCGWVYNGRTAMRQEWIRNVNLKNLTILGPFGYIEFATMGFVGDLANNGKPGFEYDVQPAQAKQKITLSNKAFIPEYMDDRLGDIAFSQFVRDFTRTGAFTKKFLAMVKPYAKRAHLRRRVKKGILGAPESFAYTENDHGEPESVWNEEKGEEEPNPEYVKLGAPNDARCRMDFVFPLVDKMGGGLKLAELVQKYPGIVEEDNWALLELELKRAKPQMINKLPQMVTPGYNVLPLVQPFRVELTEEERKVVGNGQTHRTEFRDIPTTAIRKGGLFAPLFQPAMRQLATDLKGFQTDPTGIVPVNTLVGGVYIPPEGLARLNGYTPPKQDEVRQNFMVDLDVDF